jgi:iron complex outermembrane recepter protein
MGNTRQWFGGGWLALAWAAMSAQGQSPTEVVELETFAVEEQARAHLDTLNPASRGVDGVFFDGMRPVEIPRAVLQLSPRTLTLFQIEDFGDLEKIGAGTERYNFFGVPGAPVIRGWQGSAYYNGMLRAYQRNEMPTSFGSLEAIDVVKGPAPAQFITSHVGGYANMVPKAPYFDEPRGSLELRLGSDTFRHAQLDYGAPFHLTSSMPAAYRLSLSWQEAGSYYTDIGNDFVSLYGAVKVRLSDTLRLFTGGEFFDFRSNENAGWNRPTRRLLAHDQYVIGEPLSLVRPSVGGVADRDLIGDFTAVPASRRPLFRALVAPAEAVDAAVAAGALSAAQRELLVNMADPAARAAVYAGLPEDILQTTSGYVYTPEYFLAGGTVFTAPISGRTVLSDPDDFADSRDFLWFLDLEGQPSPGFSWKHQVLFEDLSTRKRSSYGYAFENEQRVFDNRLTLSHVGFGDSVSWKLGYGGQLRYSEALQLQDFWSEPFARRDLLNPESPNGRMLSGGQVNPNTGGDYWRGGFGAGGPGGHAVRSRLWQGGVFAFGELGATDRFTLLAGARAERARFIAKAPREAGYTDSNRQSGAVNSFNWSVQPVLHLREGLNLYGVYQEAKTFHPTQGGAVVNEANFGASELLEGGLKAELLGGRLFATAAAYEWTQERFSDRSNISQPFEARGFELEAVWEAAPGWTILASYGDRVIRKLSPLGFRTVPFGAGDPTGAGDEEIGVALQAGQLFSNISAAARAAYGDALGDLANPPANPDLIQGGAPERTAKLYLVFEDSRGWGFAGGPTWRAGFWHNYDRTLWIEDVVVWNAQVFYERERWALRLHVENLGDARYFLGAEPEFAANTLITRAPGRSYRLSFRYGF